MPRLYYVLIVISFISSAKANIFYVGPNEDFNSPNALFTASVVDNGDTIFIESSEYIGNDALAVWQANNLFIKGINGRPHLIANGEYIWGKGIWVCAGNNITVENIEFSGATVPDRNGAGIRLDGIGITVRNCYFHNNENGLLSNSPYAGTVLIEHSEFGYQGYGDGLSHNLYINHVDTFIFLFNYSHHANIGHCLKSRADHNFILFNRIMDEEEGNSSRLIDIPNGGKTVIMGNTLMQGQNAENKNMIGYGLEGLTNETPSNLYIVNNTFVSTRNTPCLFLDVEDGTVENLVANNIFAGSGELIEGPLTLGMTNFFSEIDSLFFQDFYNYRLTPLSPVINMGSELNDVNLNPGWEYEHPSQKVNRFEDQQIDIGAFEYRSVTSTSEVLENVKLYPNPTDGVFVLPNVKEGDKILIHNSIGEMILNKELSTGRVDVSHFIPGLYFVSIGAKENIQILVIR